MSNREVVVVSGARTAIGAYGGSLKELPATKLGATAIRDAVARAKVDPAAVGHVVMGSVIHGEAKDMYLSRVAAIEAGISVGTPCLTVNRLCGSGLQAIVSATQHILLGDCDVAVAGGAESMSRAAYFLPAGRWGQRIGDATARHGHVRIIVVQHAHRRAAPAGQGVDQAPGQRRGPEYATVQQQRVGHGQPAVVRQIQRLARGSGVLAQEAGQVARDCGIAGIGQAEFDDGATRALGVFLLFVQGEEALDHDLFGFGAR